jgi:hypothetical protein
MTKLQELLEIEALRQHRRPNIIGKRLNGRTDDKGVPFQDPLRSILPSRKV